MDIRDEKTDAIGEGEPAQPAPQRPYHHLPDGRFRNPEGSPRRTVGRGAFWRFMWRQWRNRSAAPEVPEGHVLPREQALASLAEYDGRDSITWLGHAAFLIRIGGRTLLTDPYLSEIAGPAGFGPKRFVPSGLQIDDLPPLDAVLVSHNHYDHLDAKTLAALPDRQVQVIAPLRLGAFFRRRGFAQVSELDWYQSAAVGEVRVQALPAIHFSRRGLFDRNRTLWVSFAVEGGGRRLFFSGDTGYGPVFGEIGARAGPFDLAIVGIAAYEPREIMRASHTTPEEALQLARDIRAAAVLGMHWGTVVLTEEPPFEPPRRFREAAARSGWPEDRVWLMRIGETRALPGPWPGN